jgi:GNAT superfamily N-acetyltransferase
MPFGELAGRAMGADSCSTCCFLSDQHAQAMALATCPALRVRSTLLFRCPSQRTVMAHLPVVDSIASSAGSIGADAVRHLDVAIRGIMSGQGAVDGGSYLRLITGEQHPFGNMAVLSDANSQAASDEAVAPLLDLKVPTLVLYTTGISDAIARSLVARGFSQGAMPAMAVDINRMKPTGLDAGYEWARTRVGEDADEWSQVLAAGYGLPLGLARMFAPEALWADMTPAAGTQFFGIRHDGKLVATSMLVLANGLAGIYCVATLPGERGKGLGAHVTAEALRAAHRIGYRVGVLQSSEEGHSVYLGLGFADLGSVPTFIRMSA